jgi:hypothetical protein
MESFQNGFRLLFVALISSLLKVSKWELRGINLG